MSRARQVVLAALGTLLLGIGITWYVLSSRTPEVVPAAPVPTSPTHEVVGMSVEGRTIDAYTYGTGSKHVLFVGGIHGGYEWNSVLLAYQMMDYFATSSALIPADVSVTIIPSANPDGVFKVVGKEGRFAASDVTKDKVASAPGRFNAHTVDLNRNFDCKWQATSTWQTKTVSAGTGPFSEPEALAIKNSVEKLHPVAVVFWHSQSNAVYASECTNGILPGTRTAMTAYASKAKYPAVDSFDAYPVTGDAEGWLASVGIPAITVELQTHETVEFERNLEGVKALLTLASSGL